MKSAPKLKINGLWSQFVPFLNNREDFLTHGSLQGFAFENGTNAGKYGYGMLDRNRHESYDKAEYSVLSYNTPIAWFVRGERGLDVLPDGVTVYPVSDGYWVFDPTRYSVSTSKQQGRIQTALSQLNERARLSQVGIK